MAAVTNEVLLLSLALSEQRRKLGSRSPHAFAEVYLKNNCHAPFSRMHKEIFALLAEMTQKRKGRLAIAAPRGHAKSTIVTMAYVLWCILYRKERLVLIASNTREQGETLLKDIKHQLRDNTLLAMDFPKVCRAPKPKPWRGNRIQLANGAMISVYGAGQSPRGIKNDRDRPGLIIADDLENEEHAQVEEQREKLRTWFSSTLLNTGHPDTNVVVVGTILHQDSLLANLIDPIQCPGWYGYKYQAVERFSDNPHLWQQWVAILRRNQDYHGATGLEAAKDFYVENEEDLLAGTQVLWPEWEGYYVLMLMKETEGLRSFQSEKQNEPIDPNQCIFKLENITFWDDHYPSEQRLLQAIGDEAEFYGACDPSLGRSTQGDFTAIVVMAKHCREKTNYVIIADLIHCTPNDAIERILTYARMYRFQEFVVESNNFQQLMVQDLQRRASEDHIQLNVSEVSNRSNKRSRIGSLEPYINQGRIQLSRRHRLLQDQLLQFPLAKNDDGPDALEMAVTVATKIQYSCVIEQV